MKKAIFAIALSLSVMPLVSSANSAPTESYDSGLSRVLWISAGMVAGVLLTDFLVGGVITAPIVSMTDPVVLQARSAGAVFGEQVVAATGIRDAQARASMIHALLVGSGAILGGWLTNKVVVNP